MKLIYHPTALESWVSKFYKNLNIYTPEDLDEDIIAHALNIFLFRKEISSYAYEEGNFKSITIDSRLSHEEQREHFYHELCHILRHAGRQTMMPKAFRELQEWDARHFVRYAAIPYHMLKYIDFKDTNFLVTAAKLFQITPKLVQERIEKIKNNSIPSFIPSFSFAQLQQNKKSNY